MVKTRILTRKEEDEIIIEYLQGKTPYAIEKMGLCDHKTVSILLTRRGIKLRPAVNRNKFDSEQARKDLMILVNAGIDKRVIARVAGCSANHLYDTLLRIKEGQLKKNTQFYLEKIKKIEARKLKRKSYKRKTLSLAERARRILNKDTCKIIIKKGMFKNNNAKQDFLKRLADGEDTMSLATRYGCNRNTIRVVLKKIERERDESK